MATTFIITGSDEKARQDEIGRLIKNIPSANLLDDATEKKGINEVKSWQSWLNLSSGEMKALLVRKSDILTPEAQNAFLKTLEEPPENTLIILETENIHTLLPTVISRCQIIDTGSTNAVFTPEKHSNLDQNLELLSKGVGIKFALAQKISKDRETAVVWVDNMISFLHTRSLENSSISKNLEFLLVTKKQLNSNVNVRLALENLFLKW